MEIVPVRPPGRADRKVGHYASEIVRLRALGYTFEAIREALELAGIQVSKSALCREVKRSQKQSLPSEPARRSPDLTTPPTWPGLQPLAEMSPLSCAAEDTAGEPLPSKGLTSRQLAEAFFLANPSNPLFKAKEPA